MHFVMVQLRIELKQSIDPDWIKAGEPKLDTGAFKKKLIYSNCINPGPKYWNFDICMYRSLIKKSEPEGAVSAFW